MHIHQTAVLEINISIMIFKCVVLNINVSSLCINNIDVAFRLKQWPDVRNGQQPTWRTFDMYKKRYCININLRVFILETLWFKYNITKYVRWICWMCTGYMNCQAKGRVGWKYVVAHSMIISFKTMLCIHYEYEKFLPLTIDIHF